MRRALIFLLTIAAPARAADAPAPPDGVVQVCAACHGMDGNSEAADIPRLAGQFPEYLQKQLKAFKSPSGGRAHRASEIMAPIAAQLDEGEISSLAAWFAAQKPKPGVPRRIDRLDQGRAVFLEGNPETGLPACVSCHRPDGGGIRPDFPRLAGQQPDYIEAQLSNWQAVRGGKGKLMSIIAPLLQRDEIQAVADYLAQLPGGP